MVYVLLKKGRNITPFHIFLLSEIEYNVKNFNRALSDGLCKFIGFVLVI